MGSAHGWAGTLLKNEYPNSYVVISDLVADSLQFSYKYGNLLGIQVDERWAFNSRDIPFQEETFDRIFTFAAFHFGDNGDYTNALEQMIRVLKPGGKILLLYEPYSPGYLYKFAFKRANRRKHIDGVDEDVLLAAKLKKIAEKNNCHFSVEFFPFYLHRSGVGNTLYYFLLSKLAGLQKILINCINVTIEKPT
jgi:SAM-dependent methyltransferase